MVWVVSPQQVGRIIERFPDYWDHPDPNGAVAVVKDLLNGIVNSVNASNIVTGPPPSTEEEAFQQNYARDYGPGAAFSAVKHLAPGVPKGTGGLLARGFADAARNGLQGAAASAGKQAGGLAGRLEQTIEEQGAPRAIERPGSLPTRAPVPTRDSPGQIAGTPAWASSKPFAVPGQQPTLGPPFKGYGEAPSNVSPNPAPPAWDSNRPFAVPTAPPPQRPPFVGYGGSPPQALKDPDFRQLSRMPSAQSNNGAMSSDLDQSTVHDAANSSDDSNASPEAKWAARRKPTRARIQSSNNNGNGSQGAGGSGGSDDESASLDNRGGGQVDTHRRCMRASTRDAQAWTDFCDDLDPDDLQLRAICRSNAYRSEQERKGFCSNNFTI
jgi:hypothetical protein